MLACPGHLIQSTTVWDSWAIMILIVFTGVAFARVVFAKVVFTRVVFAQVAFAARRTRHAHVIEERWQI